MEKAICVADLIIVSTVNGDAGIIMLLTQYDAMQEYNEVDDEPTLPGTPNAWKNQAARETMTEADAITAEDADHDFDLVDISELEGYPFGWSFVSGVRELPRDVESFDIFDQCVS